MKTLKELYEELVNQREALELDNMLLQMEDKLGYADIYIPEGEIVNE